MCEITLFSIGAVADKLGVGIETLRFYERKGLIEPSRRQPGGHRQYSPEDIDQLQFIKRMQKLSFSLKEIKDLLEFLKSKNLSCEDILKKFESKAAQFKEEIINRRQILAKYERILNACLIEENCTNSGDCVWKMFEKIDWS